MKNKMCLENQYSKWLKDLRTRNTIYMQCTNNLWDCLKEPKWCITRPRLSRMASEPHWSLPDAAEQRALGSSLKDSSCTNEKSLADLLLGKNSVLPYSQIIRFQKNSHFVPGIKWKHLKGKRKKTSLKLLSSCTAGHCSASPRCNHSQRGSWMLSSPLCNINLSNWGFALG